jgi:hypothetical protein
MKKFWCRFWDRLGDRFEDYLINNFSGESYSKLYRELKDYNTELIARDTRLSAQYGALLYNYRALQSIKAPPAQCDGPWQTRYAELEIEYQRMQKDYDAEYLSLAQENFELKRRLNSFHSIIEIVEAYRKDQEKANG